MGALPEDTSRGVEAVKVPETRNAESRYLGRLGGDKKNQDYFYNWLSWAASESPLFGGGHAECYILFCILKVSRKCLKITFFTPFTLIYVGRLVLKIALFALWIDGIYCKLATRRQYFLFN